MSDLNISGRMKVISFQKEFLKSYPHLYPSLRYPNDKVVEDDNFPVDVCIHVILTPVEISA